MKHNPQLETRLCALGFSFDEIKSLRRISATLTRWAEAECGTGNEAGTVTTWIERDDKTGLPYRYYDTGPRNWLRKVRVPDRERGALKRLTSILQHHAPYVAYHQTDPRGCSLYIIPKDTLGDRDPSQWYSSLGIAVL